MKGDVFSNVANVAAGSTLSFQPTGENEFLVISFGSIDGTHMRLTNGTISSKFATTTSEPVQSSVRLAINSQYYLELKNESGADSTLGFTAIQLK